MYGNISVLVDHGNFLKIEWAKVEQFYVNRILNDWLAIFICWYRTWNMNIRSRKQLISLDHCTFPQCFFLLKMRMTEENFFYKLENIFEIYVYFNNLREQKHLDRCLSVQLCGYVSYIHGFCHKKTEDLIGRNSTLYVNQYIQVSC